jgi:signal transduction histidine kinase
MDGIGRIDVTLCFVGKQNVAIDIKDSGKGIPKSKIDEVFTPGFTTKKRGWGLGLALARRIIENYHRGKLVVKWSEVGKGTTFRILLNR